MTVDVLIKEGNGSGRLLQQVRSRITQHPHIPKAIVVRIRVRQSVPHHAQQGHLRRRLAIAAHPVQTRKDRQQLSTAGYRQALDAKLFRAAGRGGRSIVRRRCCLL